MDVASVLALVRFAIDEEPAVAESLRNLFGKGDPAVADWDAEIARTKALKFKDLVPDSQAPTPPPAP